MHIIEITESKVEHLADTIGKMLHYGGKAMECIDELRRGGDRMGYRDDDGYDRMGERGYGRYGMRDEDMRPEDYDRMGERYRQLVGRLHGCTYALGVAFEVAEGHCLSVEVIISGCVRLALIHDMLAELFGKHPLYPASAT